jgi:hypothetical protein
MQMMDGKWIDQAKQSYEYNKAHGHTVRIVYTTPPAQPAPVQPVSGVVLREGLPTLLQDKHIKENDKRLYTAPPEAQPAPVQEPVAWMYQCTADNSGPVLSRHRTDWAESGTGLWTETPLYTAPPAAQPAVPDFKAFKEWAAAEGYDVAYTHDGIKWICLNPMTADLWKTWQAATPSAPQPVPVKTYHDGKPWPVAPKPWVWLTKEDVESWDLPVNPTVFEFAQFIEIKLKEKNT